MSDETEVIRRAVLQHLDQLRRAGVTHRRRVAPAAVVVAAAPAPPPRLSPSPPVPRPASTTVNPPVRPEPETVMPRGSRTPNVPVAQQIFVPLDLPATERPGRLEQLRQVVAACTRCRELADTRTQTVFGIGNPNARLLFVGEAPGADEDKQGEPFVGRAGQLMNDIIKACRITREEIYICNILRCRPPGNRQPSPEEAGNCREYLDGQIAIVNPEYIVCWGATAARNLLASEDNISKMRGRFFQYGRAKVLCTYHPSYLLRNPAAKKDVWEDMKFLFLDMGIDLAGRS